VLSHTPCCRISYYILILLCENQLRMLQTHIESDSRVKEHFVLHFAGRTLHTQSQTNIGTNDKIRIKYRVNDYNEARYFYPTSKSYLLQRKLAQGLSNFHKSQICEWQFIFYNENFQPGTLYFGTCLFSAT
jgi:hypothetical protein